MKYLVDENISKKEKFLKVHKEYRNVKNEIKEGVEDSDILKHAKEKDFVIYTQDKRFTLYALIEGLKVRYLDQETKKEYHLTAQQNQF